jgi:hypothetical protein
VDARSQNHPNPIIRRLESIFQLSNVERAALEALPMQIHALKADQDIVREGDRPSRAVGMSMDQHGIELHHVCPSCGCTHATLQGSNNAVYCVGCKRLRGSSADLRQEITERARWMSDKRARSGAAAG